ncbi:twin-arginine translocase TatA/TatE family subunit [Gallicola sp. Sow4_E12]|uniref:twin-arginine translocase TatA/TatE family subunit n=1 Tax=Gallicola sp. Sow4_E12 TaxID=3438785 RepID=UPI003F912B9C
MFGKIGMQELVVIAFIALLIFGPKNLPEIGKTIGRTIRNVKKEVTDGMDGKPEKEENVEDIK